MLTLLRKEKVVPKATNEMKFLQPQAGFMVFSTNEVRFKGVRARPVGGAGAHAPEEVHLHERSEVLWFYHVFPISKALWCSNKRSLVCLSPSPGSRTNFAAL